jgi:hypothetical protein
MTVLSAAQDAAIKLAGVASKPLSLFSTSPLGQELASLANEAATAIAEYHEWQKLKILKSYAGDGSTIAFDLPTDYGRMLKKGALHSTTWKNANYRQARDEDEWLYLQDTSISGTPGVWILLGGQMQIFPPMASAEQARHYYISSNIVVAADGTTKKPKFTLDTDVFLLSERLLTLALIWRWRSLKRLEYAEDMANYEVALAEEVTKDKATRPLVVGQRRMAQGQAIAYPGVLGP